MVQDERILNAKLLLYPLLMVCFAARAEITEQQLEADCAKVPIYASRGEQFYKARTMPKRVKPLKNR